MKVGVKFGPDNWEYVLSRVNPSCAEIWFRLDWKEKFQVVFDELNKRKIPFGIHYWAVIDGQFEPNLAYEKNGLADKTAITIRETLDLAHKNGATYVNVHPGAYSLRKINLDESYMKVMEDTEIPVDQGNDTLLYYAKELKQYAVERNTLFLLETLPKNELSHWRDNTGRNNIQSGNSVGVDMLAKLGKQGILLTNDFGHTIATRDDLDRNSLYEYLLETTRKLHPYTKLIHLNTVCPPFNGTDSHNGVLEEDFEMDVLPNREQVIELLRLFKNREDVWIIPEPQTEKMVENYFEIQKIITEL